MGVEGDKELLTIQQSTTRQIQLNHATLRPKLPLDIIRETQIRKDSLHLSNLPLLHHCPHLFRQREIPCPNCLHQEQILLLCELNQDLRLRRICCERLLAQHMLSCLEAQPCVLVVVRVWRCNVDDVNVGVCD